MEQYIRPLQYSFAGIDVENYFDIFFGARRDFMKRMGYDASVSIDLNWADDAGCNEISAESTVKDIECLLRGIVARNYMKTHTEKDRHSLEVLQKKFELFQRIFCKYDQGWKRMSEDFKNAGIYALLSTGLFLLYQESGNFNYLNSAIKLNDFIIRQAEWIQLKDHKFINVAFALEEHILTGMYQLWN